MSYNISTMFIWQFFNGECECPMCKLKQKTEHDLADTYLNHAVMVEEERAKVNKYGFCERHFDQLYSGKNKLGLALQVDTRIKYLNAHLKTPTDVKSAIKQAEKLKKINESCVMCKTIEFHMERYFETVAKMYYDDEKFRTVNFKQVKGFCYNCYVRLLENAKYAKKLAPEFINEITEIFKKHLNLIDEKLTEFTMAFDYHSTGLPSKTASLSLNKASILLYGEKPITPDRK